MDIKAKIEELAAKINSDPALLERFKNDPVGAVESLIGVDLPNDQIEKVAEGIKAKISLDDAGDKLNELGSKLGGLFGKKN